MKRQMMGVSARASVVNHNVGCPSSKSGGGDGDDDDGGADSGETGHYLVCSSY